MSHFAHLVSAVVVASQQLKRIADALESEKQPEEIKQPEKITRTYLDVLKERLPHRVGEGYRGGAHGCPYLYFLGAPGPQNCKGVPCQDCWNKPYKGEEFIME